MDHVITAGDVLKVVLMVCGAVGVIAIPLYFLAALGRGMSR